jgi:RNA polymerase sigma-70 factor (ECF subfamily)
LSRVVAIFRGAGQPRVDHLMNDSSRSEITRVLSRLQAGEIDQRAASDHIFEAAYNELRRLASHLMRGERSDHTLRPTALVHEAYVRLADTATISWQSRAQFFAIAARAMRNVLVDHARRRAADKRGGQWQRVTLDPELGPAHDVKILRFEEILVRLTELDGRMARVVELRVFGGMTVKEIAHVLAVSPRTVDNDWGMARMWFTRELANSAQ